ncbi:Bug family tripartite tricarboxylate transporter substrate binding protein [Bordetella genomosp. 9]|uniref:LacI family transcriptional regulator n=1 Tax=Bordetella genomosp. 9 TaxID=1416803 RepID=A0A1W6Z178_9BORD|nr:tripartite tricarboxylate transporter substrate binding protein [Bordetella genomosp. 9]ARP87001.1 LacI family transcriptional regulator [Bordetella genomosp. 9]ARP90986.1 LacI family transcriptional regulator [Bordetella genomosp. 9]
MQFGKSLLGRLLAGTVLCATALAAHAADWPSRPITLVIPFPPGGTTDMVGRPLAEALSKRLGQPVIVDNRAGAGGTIGAGYVARQAPDGYTLFLSTIAHSIAPSTYDKLTYDFQKDFAPITVVASSPNLLIVNKDLPVKSVAELIDYAKKNPGKLNYGSAGVGSTEHLAGELFKRMAKIDIAHVPYKGGAPMMTDLMGGQIQMAIETSGSAMAQIKADTVRALGVSSEKPSPYFPGIPAIAETVPGYTFSTWYGLVVPAKVPADVQAKLYAATVDALKDPMMVKALETIGADAGGNKPEEFKKFIADQTQKWHEILKGQQ